ncbi:MAG: lysophospholipid acyltransferase family protein [Bacteroidota bacterium]
MKKSIIVLLLRSFAWRIIAWWCRSLKIQLIGQESIDALRHNGKNYVVAFWHGSMLMGWFLHRPSGDRRISALVSQSKDGEYLSSVLERWGYTMIRGSSHVGGKEAMQLMTDAVNSGSSLVITPDGPRGPRHEMKMGAIRVAQKTGVPLVLVGIAAKNKKKLRSWDAFEVPIPFSRVCAVYSDPVFVPSELQGESLDAFKCSLQQRLNELTQRAEGTV